jgi:hypothetical protein
VARFAFGLLVGFLALSVSGVSSLMVYEPCSSYEQPGREDGTCPPICVTCGCCAQAADPTTLPMTSSPVDPVADVRPLIPGLPTANARDILHVPKQHLA